MLKVLRAIVVIFCCVLISVLGTLYSVIRFRNPNNVSVVARWFGRLYPLFGLQVEHRFAVGAIKWGHVFISVITKTIMIW